MIRSRHLVSFALAYLAIGSGCMPKMTVEDLAAMRVVRPVEIDQLQVFVGEWKWEGELTVAGLDEPLSFTGHSTAQMEHDGWHLVTRESGDISAIGHTVGLGTWAYDIRAKKFRTSWLDSMGSISVGTAHFNKNTEVWHLHADTRSPHGNMTGSGRVHFTGPDTMNWSWKDHVLGGLIKVMEFNGKATRVK